MLPRIPLTSILILAVCAVFATAADWPQFRGPDQNGIAREKDWLGAWPADGPRKLWEMDLGVGASDVAVADGRLYTLGNIKDKDIVYCLDAATGKESWRFAYDAKLDKRSFEGGPAATPTVDGDLVYTVSHMGDLYALNKATGKPVWSKNYVRDFAGQRPQWGWAGSPLVHGKLLILDIGGNGTSTVALNKTTGALVWKSGSDAVGYSTPVILPVEGKPTLLVLKAKVLVALNPEDGKEMWRHPWQTNYDVNASAPILVGKEKVQNKIFLTTGYGTGCGLIEVTAGKVRELWRNKNMASRIASPVSLDDTLYGINDKELVALDVTTGKQLWKRGGVGEGTITATTDDKLIVLGERGQLLVADADPAAFKPLRAADVIGGRCWVAPVLAGGNLYVRNNQGRLLCLAMK